MSEELHTRVERLLRESRSAHEQYQQAARVAGNRIQKRAHLTEAARLRTEANDADPNHDAPAWKSEPEKFIHADLAAFYAKQLTD